MANIASYIGVLEMRDALAAARTLGLGVAMLEIRKAQDIAPAIEALKGGAGLFSFKFCLTPARG